MNRTTIIFGIVYEVITAVFIYKLWTRKRRVGIVERCFLTVALLVPFAGWFIYAFLAPPLPEGHSDHLSEHSGGYGGGTGGSSSSDHASH